VAPGAVPGPPALAVTREGAEAKALAEGPVAAGVRGVPRRTRGTGGTGVRGVPGVAAGFPLAPLISGAALPWDAAGVPAGVPAALLAPAPPVAGE